MSFRISLSKTIVGAAIVSASIGGVSTAAYGATSRPAVLESEAGQAQADASQWVLDQQINQTEQHLTPELDTLLAEEEAVVEADVSAVISSANAEIKAIAQNVRG